ncbi:cyd operon protein YbgT [Burkholderia pseudomallei 1655]|nr:cyd operon protein YbgT [Burkholderia pseudomallei 1655]
MRRIARPAFCAIFARFCKFRRSRIMWYFSWILGIGVALAFGIINAMWLEARQKRDA